MTTPFDPPRENPFEVQPAPEQNAVPGVRGVLIVRLIFLGWMVMENLVTSLLGVIGAAGDWIWRAIEISWLGLEISLVVVLVPFARGQRGRAAEPLVRAALWLAGIDVVISVLQSFVLPGVMGGGLMSVSTAVYVCFIAAIIAFDVVFWFALMRIRPEAIDSWMTPVFLILRVLTALMSVARVLLPYESRRGLFEGSFAVAYRWTSIGLHLVLEILPCVVLWRIAKHGGSASAAVGGPAPAISTKDQAQRDLIVGALWLGGGLLITLVSFAAAQGAGGGRYVITTGAIVYGIARIVRGLGRSA